MAIIFTGAEVEEFLPYTYAFGLANSSSYNRTAFSRGSVTSTSGGSGTTTGYIKAPFTAQTTFYATARVYCDLQNSGNYFMWFQSGANVRLRLKTASASPCTVELSKFDGTTTTVLATSTITFNNLTRFDVAINYASSGGYVKVYMDNYLAISYSGDPTAGGSTSLDGLCLSAGYPSYTARWSEVIVATTDTRTMHLLTLAPNAAGSTSSWSGSYTDIDELITSDLDVLSSATANQVTSVNTTGMPSGYVGLSPLQVKVVAVAARGSSGPSKLALGVRTNSTDSFPTATTLDTGYTTPVTTTYDLNPVTTAAWTVAEIEALQLAFRSET
jgi:hypothetical protein